jgi:hypothetical protein
MTIIFACFLGCCTFCVLILFIEYGDHWIAKSFPGEVEMPTPEQLYPSSHAPRARVVQTYEGDSLAQGVCRAMILAMEYKVVVLIHDFVAVMVFPGDDAEEIATEWHETRRVLNTIKCNGK